MTDRQRFHVLWFRVVAYKIGRLRRIGGALSRIRDLFGKTCLFENLIYCTYLNIYFITSCRVAAMSRFWS